MSVKQSGLVWELDLPHGQLWVLMAMVDHAAHDGTGIYPGIELIAWKTGYSGRQVQRIIAELVKADILEVVRQSGQHRPTEYRAHLDRAPRKEPFRHDKMSPLNEAQTRQNVTPERSSDTTKCHPENTPGVTFPTPRGDIAMSPEPYEPSDSESHPPIPLPPSAPAPSAGWVGGGEQSEPSARTEPNPASVARLIAAGAKSPTAIRSAARLPLARIETILAEDAARGKGVGASVRRCIVEADNPELSAAIAAARPTTPPEAPDAPRRSKPITRATLAAWGLSPTAPPGGD